MTTAKNLNDRKLQRALMQFFEPENDFEVREALIKAGRADLIGRREGLIPANPPKEALEARPGKHVVASNRTASYTRCSL